MNTVFDCDDLVREIASFLDWPSRIRFAGSGARVRGALTATVRHYRRTCRLQQQVVKTLVSKKNKPRQGDEDPLVWPRELEDRADFTLLATIEHFHRVLPHWQSGFCILLDPDTGLPAHVPNSNSFVRFSRTLAPLWVERTAAEIVQVDNVGDITEYFDNPNSHLALVA